MPEFGRILVTGGAGFIGSHLCRLLLHAGHSVTAIDNLSTGRLDNIEDLRRRSDFLFVEDSIANGRALHELVREADVVIHLAAAVGVRLIVERPAYTLDTNVMGTHNVLEATRQHGTKVLVASSSEVYGKGTRVPFSEDDHVILGPTSRNRWAYAASKMLDEFLAFGYHREHGLPVVTFRLFNTVGPGQTGRYGMVLPRFVGQAMRGDDLTVYGDGTQTRSFCDVRDAVEAIAALADSDDALGRVFNIGGTEEIAISDLAERVIRRTGSHSKAVLVPYQDIYGADFEDMQRRVPDITRLQELTGWRPRISLDETIDAVHDDLRGRDSEV
jgi:UDP-glucose 4-epimerase